MIVSKTRQFATSAKIKFSSSLSSLCAGVAATKYSIKIVPLSETGKSASIKRNIGAKTASKHRKVKRDRGGASLSMIDSIWTTTTEAAQILKTISPIRRCSSKIRR